MSNECHCQTHPRNRSRSTDVPSLPVKDPHPQKVVEDRVVKGVPPFHSKFFRGTTHIRPKAIIPVTLREVVILPMLKTLKGVVVLFPRKDSSMPTTLGNLKKPWSANNTSSAFPRPLPSRLWDKAQLDWWRTQQSNEH